MFDDPGRRSPERALWQEVLYRAILDARLDSDGGKIPRDRQEEYIEARAYLTEPSEDLALVCEMAGVDMDALMERMRERKADLSLVVRAKIIDDLVSGGNQLVSGRFAMGFARWGK